MQTYGLQRSLFGELTRLQTTKRVELFRVKEFVAVALEAYGEVWWCMWHPPGARPRRSRMFILLAGAPILFIDKNNGSLQPCVRGLNNLTVEPVPVAFDQGSTLLVKVSIPTGKGSLPGVSRVHPKRPVPVAFDQGSTLLVEESIPTGTVFIRLLSIFHPRLQ